MGAHAPPGRAQATTVASKINDPVATHRAKFRQWRVGRLLCVSRAGISLLTPRLLAPTTKWLQQNAVERRPWSSVERGEWVCGKKAEGTAAKKWGPAPHQSAFGAKWKDATRPADPYPWTR